MKQFHLTTLFIIILTNSFAQKIFDKNTKQPIPLALIYSKNANFQTQSYIDGHIDTFNLSLVKDVDSIYIQHLAYETEAILKGPFQSLDSIFLTPKIFEGKEFVVTGSKSKELQKFNVHYQRRQWRNNQPKYYIDGKAEYFTKRGKLNFRRFYQQTRNFENSKLVEQEKVRGTMLSFSSSVPSFQEQYLPANFVKKYQLKITTLDSITFTLKNTDKEIVGQIVKDSSYYRYSIRNFSLIDRSRHAFNTEVITKNFNVEMVFKNLGQDIFKTKNFNFIVFQKIYSTFWVKHDKDKEFEIVSQMSELYVEKIEYLDYFKLNKYPSVSWITSNYTDPFWEYSDCEFYDYNASEFIENLNEN